MKTNIQGSRTWWMRCTVLFASQLIILLLIIATGRLAYATNDDTTMVAIASGGYGSPSEYVINLHLLLGYLLKGLFTICNEINWVTVLFIAVDLLSILVIDMLLVTVQQEKVTFYCSGMVLCILFLIMLAHFTFTVVAYLAGIAGLMGITYAVMSNDKNGRRILIGVLAGIAFVFCLLVRAEVIKSLLIVYAGYAVTTFFYHKKYQPFVIVLVSVCLMSFSINSNLWMNNLNPTQKAFLEWGETRSAALDCAAVPYNEDVFTERGITYNQYQAIYNAFYYDFDDVDTDTMETLIDLNDLSNKYDFDIMGMLIKHFSVWGNWRKLFSFVSLYRIVFAAVLIFFLLFGKREDYMILFLTWGSVLATEFVFGFIKRAIYRVLMPNYAMGVIIMLLTCSIDPSKEQKLSSLNISLKKMFITATVLLACGSMCVYSVWSTRRTWMYSGTERAVLDYMAENDDKIFLAGDVGVFAIDVADSVWNHPGKRGIWNLIGNWETYSVPYFELMEKQGIQNPYDVLLEAVDNDKILLLTKLGDDFPASRSWILGLVEENYGITVEFEKVEDISLPSHGDGVNHWVTYKLATKEVQ